MIDFRYHLVSIVAVFLALSVGIVIGATSLQGKVAGTLEGQVTQLRDDKQQLRGELGAANEGSRRQDQYAEDVAPRALNSQLKGRTVAVVALPDTPGSFVRDSRDSLALAGATVTSTTELSTNWVDGDAKETMQVLKRAGRAQGVAVDSLPESRLGGLVLAEALSVKPGAGASARDLRPGLSTLVDSDLISVEPSTPPRADSIVVLWPGMEKSVPGWVNLVTAVGLSGRPAVGVSAEPVKSNGQPADAMISTLRDSAEVTGTMSTIDHGERPTGLAAMVLALRDEYSDNSGHYGLDEDAVAAAPKVNEKAEEPEP
ncbi:copper transporter [Demetria terragena]|uniref:copper transporter n=1 Tax=Demetria terragena TaxID=63959 RepID=UPI00038022CF|nr:copper transporter [Demetria terragena]